MSGDTWVFGYGSLVSPTSMATTIGRTVVTDDVAVAHLDGYGRRWNYGSMHLRGDWHIDGTHIVQGLVVSLGLTAADDESCNGVIVRVTADELAQLDWRERDYERTDVTEQIRLEHGDPRGRVMTYVPRSSAIERYSRPATPAAPAYASRTGNSWPLPSRTSAATTTSGTRRPLRPMYRWST